MSKKVQKKPVQKPRPVRVVYAELEGATVNVSNGAIEVGMDKPVKLAEVREGFLWLYASDTDIELVPLRRVVSLKVLR